MVRLRYPTIGRAVTHEPRTEDTRVQRAKTTIRKEKKRKGKNRLTRPHTKKVKVKVKKKYGIKQAEASAAGEVKKLVFVYRALSAPFPLLGGGR